jgi:hypothetical protein
MNKEWARLIEVRNEYHCILGKMLASDRSKVVALANESLLKPDERYVALAVAKSFTPDELKGIFQNLVLTASWAHAHTGTARALVLKIPRDCVLQHIQPVIDSILATDDPDEFRRMMELAQELDRALLLRICKRAVNHPNPEIREAGEDFTDGEKE